jgi:hypothetical protein
MHTLTKYVVVSAKEKIVYGPFETVVSADVVTMRLRALGRVYVTRPLEPWTDDRVEQCSEPPIDHFACLTPTDAKTLLQKLNGSKKLE